VLEKAALQEGAQHPLDDGTGRAVRFGEPLGVDTEKLLDVLLDQAEQR
jgi:hypothetical protein